ncbi:MAG: hypothetical protein JXR43_10410, partial [Burkholderiaceae bacterium]|nr:hypothetical protein [Burkholderiaceae bacterium]
VARRRWDSRSTRWGRLHERGCPQFCFLRDSGFFVCRLWARGLISGCVLGSDQGTSKAGVLSDALTALSMQRRLLIVVVANKKAEVLLALGFVDDTDFAICVTSP